MAAAAEGETPPAEITLRDYLALAARIERAAAAPLSWRVFGQQVAPDGAERYDLYLARIPARTPNGGGRFRVLLNGGTHGDEPAGPEAVARFLEQRVYQRWPDVAFTVMPCTNPWGYVHNRREGPGGRDLNRSFRRAGPLTREVSLIKQALGRQRFDMFLDCHEDVDAPGLYVFAPGPLGRAIVDGVRPAGPLHPGDLVDGMIPLKGAVVDFESMRARRRQRAFTTWPLPRYVARYHHRLPPNASPVDVDAPMARQATIETPTCLPLDQRARMHLAAIEAALRTLYSK